MTTLITAAKETTGKEAISKLPLASSSKRVLVLIHSYENEFNLHVNEISFSYERMSTKTRFEEEAKGNSEMAYWSESKNSTKQGMVSRTNTP